MKKKIIIIFIILIVVSVLAVKTLKYLSELELNTVDPQASISIQQSKQDSLFIAEYELSASNKKDIVVTEAWIEYVWKNRFYEGKAIKEKLQGIQLVMKISSFANKQFADSSYLLNWEISTNLSQVPGSGRSKGLYVIYLKSMDSPQSIVVNINQKKDAEGSFSNSLSFILYKKG